MPRKPPKPKTILEKGASTGMHTFKLEGVGSFSVKVERQGTNIRVDKRQPGADKVFAALFKAGVNTPAFYKLSCETGLTIVPSTGGLRLVVLSTARRLTYEKTRDRLSGERPPPVVRARGRYRK